MKHKKLAVQLNYTQLGKFMPDITGFLAGHNDLGIYIGSTLIEYGEIRNIDFFSEKKWFDVWWISSANTSKAIYPILSL